MKQRLIVAIAVCLVSATASGQRTPDLEKGVRIRVTQSNGHTLTGSFVATTRDSLTVIADGVSEMRSTASREVTRIEVSKGRNRAQGAIIGGAIGLGIGVASGALLGASFSNNSGGCFFTCTRNQAAAFGASLAGGAGLLIGAIAGVATGHESWAAVQFR